MRQEAPPLDSPPLDAPSPEARAASGAARPPRVDPRAKARLRALEAAAGRGLKRGALLGMISALIWPMQAGLIAWTVAGWVAAPAALPPLWPAALFLLMVLVRALIDHRAGALLFTAADGAIAEAATAVIASEPLRISPSGSAETAALVAEKLPMLRPYLTRYRPAMARVMVVPIVLLILAATQSWAVALLLLVAGPLIPLFMALIGMAAESESRRQLDEIASMNTLLLDRLAALVDLRLLGATGRAADDLGTRADALRKRTMAVLRIAFLSSTVLELFAAIGVAMVAVYIGFVLLDVLHFGYWGGTLTLGQGMFLLLLAPEYFQPLRDLAAAWHDRAAALAVAGELAEREARAPGAALGQGAPAAALPGPLTLSLSGGVVALPGREIALPDLEIRAGEAVALTGASGAGKSTCLAALVGLVPLARGELKVCGVPLDDATADPWRARLAWLPQAPQFGERPLGAFLDVRGLGADPGPALEAAAASDIVARLPEGLGTRLGETGGGVSGGEARRLMVARALMAEGELVLADEPTADLDAETAARVIAGLGALRAAGRTLIVASHDPRLIAAMDRAVPVGGTQATGESLQ